jgi:hypothetical protein
MFARSAVFPRNVIHDPGVTPVRKALRKASR